MEVHSSNKFNNDASASSFGWSFQVDAGIFLFLYYITDASNIKIESKYEDIEITLNNNSKVFAQAKSVQDYTSATNQKEKLKDAIISLSKKPYKNNKLIYISNIPNTLKNYENHFNNCVKSYNDCLDGIKKEIDHIINSISESFSSKIKKAEDLNRKDELKKIKDCIDNFHKENFYISTIERYYGDTLDRYQSISEAILSFLVNKVKLSRDDAICIKQKLLEHWQLKFNHNSTIKDKNANIKKNMSKNELTWPIIVFLLDDQIPNIDECLSFYPDQSIKDEAEEIMNDPQSLYFERYQFSNNVLQKYDEFKKNNNEKKIDKIELKFIKEYGHEFYNEFKTLSGNDIELTEYLTKLFLYKIIIKNRKIRKIFNTVGVVK